MGCCMSTPKDDKNTLKNQEHAMQEAKVPQPQPVSKSPPLTVEEESVKEVLSETETPISKPQKVSILTQETKTQMHNMEITKEPIMNKAFEEPSEVSLLSETCSVGETFSTTTTATTVPESREDEVTSKRRIREGTRNRNRNRIHSDVSRKHSYTVEGNRVGGREKRRHKSPARVPDILPEKKILVSAGSVRRREFPEKVRRDPGESVRRRSRSPSCHRTVGTGNSHYRSELRQTDRAGRRLAPPGKCEREEVIGETDDGVLMEESIMNPHVSLECFIFL
ncbi:uncharacterized protein LOC131653745 [Vicia villosa]|uniref:uncharacterized protein LOC131653745 n=1 Tax=Vicia villosa TaxID=3911 RepID=UPI00273B25A9|nr:uncharacterized protein LOC131653745 [Vicia villosa]